VGGAAIASTVSLSRIGADAHQIDATNQFFKLTDKKFIDDRKFGKVGGAAIASTVSLSRIGADAQQIGATNQFFKLTEYI
jgi:hypothetical protein